MKNLISLLGLVSFVTGCWYAHEGDWQTATFAVAVSAATPFLANFVPQLAKLVNFDSK